MVAHGCRKRKKLICGPEGEIVVAHGRLPSPARLTPKQARNVFNVVPKHLLNHVLSEIGLFTLHIAVSYAYWAI